jgi:hypothetical protein
VGVQNPPASSSSYAWIGSGAVSKTAPVYAANLDYFSVGYLTQIRNPTIRS